MHSRRIRLPLILPIALIVVLAAAGVIVVEERSFRTQANHELRGRAEVVARGAISGLDDRRRSHATYARLLADTPGLAAAVRRGDARSSRRLLAPLQAHQVFQEITVYQADATELFHLGPPKGDRVDAALFASGVAGTTASRGMVEPAGLVVIASTPIQVGKRVAGVLVVASTLDDDALAELTRLQGAQLAIFQRDSLVATSTQRPALIRTIRGARTSPEALASVNRSLARLDLYGATQALPGGVVLGMASSADLHTVAYQRKLVVLGAVVLLLVALAAIGAFVSISVTRPLKGMAAVARRMLSGDYAGRVSPSTIPELDALSKVVNHLAEQAEGRAHVEEQLRQSQKMDAVGQLAGGIAHDFNNLLTAIVGYAELLAPELADDREASRKLHEIAKAGGRATELTNQLLSFSRKQIVQPTVIDLNEVVRETAAMVGHLIGENITLASRLDERQVCVRADAGQLSQVMLNLVLNARDAMPDGGTITIEVGLATPAEVAAAGGDQIDDGYVFVAVTDSGSGMDAHTRDHLFEPFFTTKEQGKGTGLGLSTVYGIVRGADGFVGVQSELGRGSTFRVFLPRVTEAAEPPVDPIAIEADTGCSERILVVEDEQIVRDLVVQLLEHRGYHVVAVPLPLLAIELFDSDPDGFDLLLTDVVMPGLTGVELAQKLHALRPALPVLFMSGYTDGVLGERTLVDRTDFLRKPFPKGKLEAKVRDVLDDSLVAQAV